MATTMLTQKESQSLSVARTLLVIWKHPSTSRLRRVGRLDHLTDGRYAFRYLDESRDDSEFRPLLAFPDLDSTYVSDNLPAFFRNRVMNSGRPDYEEFLSWLDLEAGNPDLPVEILARTGGPRATDTFHVVEAPRLQQDGVLSRFFISGVKYCDGALDRVHELVPGQELMLRPEPDNPVNPKAVLIDVSSNEPIGWVPDWLAGELEPLVRDGSAIRIIAEKINLNAPSHLSVLCRIER